MVKCPKCKKQIEYLVFDVDATCEGILSVERTGYLVDDLVSNMEYGKDHRCPECGETLFLDEQEANEFMKDHHGSV